MLLLVSGATRTVKKFRRVGELIVPGAWALPDSLKLVPGMWAMDNGAYSGFEPEPFMTMLERFHDGKAVAGSVAPMSSGMLTAHWQCGRSGRG